MAHKSNIPTDQQMAASSITPAKPPQAIHQTIPASAIKTLPTKQAIKPPHQIRQTPHISSTKDSDPLVDTHRTTEYTPTRHRTSTRAQTRKVDSNPKRKPLMQYTSQPLPKAYILLYLAFPGSSRVRHRTSQASDLSNDEPSDTSPHRTRRHLDP